MTVENIWYDLLMRKALNKQKFPNREYEYDSQDVTFKALQECAMITSEAVFDLNNDFQTNQTTPLWLDTPVIGDASETALVKFFQPIEEIGVTRGRRKVVQLDDGSLAKMPFNSTNKYALTIVEYQTGDSNYCVFIKGAPEKIWSLCQRIHVEGRSKDID